MHPNEIILTQNNIQELANIALTLDNQIGQGHTIGPYLRALNEQALRQGFDK